MTLVQHLIAGGFLLALGACIGSFLNVVVWRLPRDESLVMPPSHCPKCGAFLRWYDNLPVFGWVFLRGRCRYCGEPISARYPIVEAATAALFLFYYVMLFVLRVGWCPPFDGSGHPIRMTTMPPDWHAWPIFAADLFLISALLAASLIDAELYIVPLGICWVTAVAGAVIHTLTDLPGTPGALSVDPQMAALALGGGVGLLLSILLMRRGVLRQSFPEGEPLLEVDRAAIAAEAAANAPVSEVIVPADSPPMDAGDLVPATDEPGAEEPELTPAEIRREIRKEMIFLMPPLVLAVAFWILAGWPAVAGRWGQLAALPPVAGFLGSLLGALVGALVVWLVRVFGSLAFGRVAMGMGDVHLMFAVGAVLGPGPATVAFFLAPFCGLLIAAWRLITRSHRELPYVPYLSLATGIVLLVYCPIATYLAPGLHGLMDIFRAHTIGTGL